MKTAVLEGPNQLTIMETEKPKCPPNGILVKVKACGLCGSDIRTIRNGSDKIKKYPVIMGHEIAGVIAESDNKNFKDGDNVAVGSTAPCGDCYFCNRGYENLCPDTIYLGNGRVDINGGHTEFVAITPEYIEHGPVVKIKEGVNYDEIALAEPLTTVMNSHERLDFGPGDTAVVIGAGPIGALHIALLKSEGIGKTIMADIFDERLKLASEASKPDMVINNKTQDLKKVVMEVTEGRGADLVIVACSAKIAQEQSVDLVRKGGNLIFFGGLPDHAKMIKVDSNVLHYSQLSLHGTYLSCPRHFFRVIDMIANKEIDVSKFICKVPLDDIHRGLELAESGKVLKVILNP